MRRMNERAFPPSVLLVDDQPSFCEALSDLLTDEGYSVLTAGDGLQALDLLGRLTPSLILLDLQMPRMNGWEFARRLAHDPHLSEVPVLVLSGIADIAGNLPHVVRGVLPKPVILPNLLRAIREHC
jgi:CheY-like chemotaxis protein